MVAFLGNTTGCVSHPLSATIYSYFRYWQQKKNIFFVDSKNDCFPPFFTKKKKYFFYEILTFFLSAKLTEFRFAVKHKMEKNDNRLFYRRFLFRSEEKKKRNYF